MTTDAEKVLEDIENFTRLKNIPTEYAVEIFKIAVLSDIRNRLKDIDLTLENESQAIGSDIGDLRREAKELLERTR